MRARAFALTALLMLPAALDAQVGRLPRPGRRTGPDPATLPPEIPPVTRALAYRRSRWSVSSYTLFSSIEAPTSVGGIARYSTLGAGTRGEFRYTDQLSATVDLTASPLGNGAITEPAELGTRFSPLSWQSEIRPFVDVRAAYISMNDTFASPSDPTGGIGGIGATSQFTDIGRYSRGYGGVAGGGFEYTLTNTIALTAELMAMRDRLTTYRLSGASNLPNGNAFWMTTFRYVIGFRYNPIHTLDLKQNPRQ